eukprot:6728717-Alexandrium_andersonii.AAC.1
MGVRTRCRHPCCRREFARRERAAAQERADAGGTRRSAGGLPSAVRRSMLTAPRGRLRPPHRSHP